MIHNIFVTGCRVMLLVLSPHAQQNSMSQFAGCQLQEVENRSTLFNKFSQPAKSIFVA